MLLLCLVEFEQFIFFQCFLFQDTVGTLFTSHTPFGDKITYDRVRHILCSDLKNNRSTKEFPDFFRSEFI